MNPKEIRIRGAREHNLKNISIALPRDKLVVITGLSGSGKSSLAFDTIYAEGQRRYVESLSAYARQFLGIMEKPLPELSAVPAEALYFIGSHSPAGHFSRMAVGVAKMVARARHKKLPLIVVDSCGLVKGKFAWRLTRGMMEMVGPDCMVLLTRVVKLESLAQLCHGREDLTCHQLKSAPGIRRKSTARRRKLREQTWKSYLQGGTRREFSLDGVALEGIPAGQGEGDWSGQIVGLHDGLGECLGLGLVSRLDWPASRLEVLTPVEERQKVKRVIFGMQRMKVHAKSFR